MRRSGFRRAQALGAKADPLAAVLPASGPSCGVAEAGTVAFGMAYGPFQRELWRLGVS
jgi:hypothetical protein